MAIELGILGAGNMAEAIARGAIGAGLLRADQILAADVALHRRALFQNELKIAATLDNREVAGQARSVLLSVKPQHMAQVLGEIRDALCPDALVISIAAGISTQFIEGHLGDGAAGHGTAAHRPVWRVIRTMPNTPMLVGEGMVAMARGRHATEEDAQWARKLFQAAADVLDVTEDKLDAVTAVSGSGPAYIFYLVEQMIRAGGELGLSAQESRQLAIKTAVGAAKMLSGSTELPEELRRKVTSPGGTTQAAITYMEQHGLPGTIVAAVKAAAQRSRELGSQKPE